MMRDRRTVPCVVILLSLLIFVCGSTVVRGQGGTGKLPPQRMPNPPRKNPPPRNNPPLPGQSSCSAKPPKQATGRTHTVNLPGGVKLEMVEIPVGSFCMGSTKGRPDEKPEHKVTIKEPFYLGKYEVTQAQWQAVMGSNPSHFKDCGGNCPVENVSWDDAQKFINKLNEDNDGFRYRLPTEAEWEYACRAGTAGDYAGNLSEMAWYGEDNDRGKTHPVGEKRPNAWALADMHGNVLEWCEDWKSTYYGAPIDGSAWLNGGEQKYRVLRGGSWVDGATSLRSAFRNANTPDARFSGIGFRLVAVMRTQ